MKKWKDYSRPERAMLITIVILLVLILFTSGRVNQGIQKGFRHFFSVPADTVQPAE